MNWATVGYLFLTLSPLVFIPSVWVGPSLLERGLITILLTTLALLWLAKAIGK